MSEKKEDQVQMASEPAEPATVVKPAERRVYPWMQGKEAFLELNPRNLPPMLRKAHAKHVAAAKKGK